MTHGPCAATGVYKHDNFLLTSSPFPARVQLCVPHVRGFSGIIVVTIVFNVVVVTIVFNVIVVTVVFYVVVKVIFYVVLSSSLPL
jgi:hypothetical protein